MTTLSTYSRLKLHLERHMYKRGAYKGESPADSSKRGKSHFRVLSQGNTMVVRMHATNILTAYDDGSIMVSTGSWWTSTTLKNLNQALHRFVPFSIGVGGRNVFSMQQHVVTCGNTTYAFYDGIRFNAEGTLTSQPQVFERKRADKAEREEFRKDIAESGFKDAFPILYANAEVPAQHYVTMSIPKMARDSVHANQWAHMVSVLKYPSYYNRISGKPAYVDWRDAWKRFMAQCTRDMTEVVPTDVFFL